MQPSSESCQTKQKLASRLRKAKKNAWKSETDHLSHSEFDFETPNSSLVHVDIKQLVNQQTFELLGLEQQLQLLKLLPKCDTLLAHNSSFCLTSEALNNEFFAKSCNDWRRKLADGKFTPENRILARMEQEKEQARVDPWKRKHFESFWGEKINSRTENWSPAGRNRGIIFDNHIPPPPPSSYTISSSVTSSSLSHKDEPSQLELSFDGTSSPQQQDNSSTDRLSPDVSPGAVSRSTSIFTISEDGSLFSSRSSLAVLSAHDVLSTAASNSIDMSTSVEDNLPITATSSSFSLSSVHKPVGSLNELIRNAVSGFPSSFSRPSPSVLTHSLPASVDIPNGPHVEPPVDIRNSVALLPTVLDDADFVSVSRKRPNLSVESPSPSKKLLLQLPSFSNLHSTPQNMTVPPPPPLQLPPRLVNSIAVPHSSTSTLVQSQYKPPRTVSSLHEFFQPTGQNVSPVPSPVQFTPLIVRSPSSKLLQTPPPHLPLVVQQSNSQSLETLKNVALHIQQSNSKSLQVPQAAQDISKSLQTSQSIPLFIQQSNSKSLQVPQPISSLLQSCSKSQSIPLFIQQSNSKSLQVPQHISSLLQSIQQSNSKSLKIPQAIPAVIQSPPPGSLNLPQVASHLVLLPPPPPSSSTTLSRSAIPQFTSNSELTPTTLFSIPVQGLVTPAGQQNGTTGAQMVFVVPHRPQTRDPSVSTTTTPAEKFVCLLNPLHQQSLTRHLATRASVNNSPRSGLKPATADVSCHQSGVELLNGLRLVRPPQSPLTLSSTPPCVNHAAAAADTGRRQLFIVSLANSPPPSVALRPAVFSLANRQQPPASASRSSPVSSPVGIFRPIHLVHKPNGLTDARRLPSPSLTVQRLVSNSPVPPSPSTILRIPFMVESRTGSISSALHPLKSSASSSPPTTVLLGISSLRLPAGSTVVPRRDEASIDSVEPGILRTLLSTLPSRAPCIAMPTGLSLSHLYSTTTSSITMSGVTPAPLLKTPASDGQSGATKCCRCGAPCSSAANDHQTRQHQRLCITCLIMS